MIHPNIASDNLVRWALQWTPPFCVESFDLVKCGNTTQYVPHVFFKDETATFSWRRRRHRGWFLDLSVLLCVLEMLL